MQRSWFRISKITIEYSLLHKVVRFQWYTCQQCLLAKALFILRCSCYPKKLKRSLKHVNHVLTWGKNMFYVLQVRNKTLMSQHFDSSIIYYSFVGFLKLCNCFVHAIIASSVIFTLLRAFTLENLYAVLYFATKLIEFLLCW